MFQGWKQPIRALVLLTGLIFAALAVQPVHAQSLDWVTQAGGTTIVNDNGVDIAIDVDGNSYVTGFFSDSAAFGAGEPNATTLISAGLGDIFVAKYAADGNLLWAKQAGGSSSDIGRTIAVDGSGNSYVAGEVHGSAVFGAGEPNATTLTGIGNADIFVAKYDSDGNLLWAKRAGGFLYDFGYDMTVDASGNAYIIGNFSDIAVFGTGDPNVTNLSSAGSYDIFVAKYGTSGDFLWVKKAGGISDDTGLGIRVDTAGNSYVTGNFSGVATFGAGETNATTLTSANDSPDIFVAKYNTVGNLLWARQAGGISDDTGRGIAIDSGGNSYVTGNFAGDAVFGAGETNATTLSSVGASRDIFVAQYGTNGNLLWASQAGGTLFDTGIRIALGGGGNLYVAGQFAGSATFGQTNPTTLTSAGGDDIFVAKYDTSGVLLWAHQDGGASNDRAYGIKADGNGSIYITGQFAGSATFGANAAALAGSAHAARIDATILTSAGGADIFVAKYTDIPLAVTLGYFLAARSEEGVRIEWSTVAESGNAGFNLFVETEAGQQQINPALIPSTVIDSIEPQRYAYDAVGVQGDFFFIELVNVNGGGRMFGPFALGVPFGAEPAAEEEGYHIFLPSVLKR